MKQGFLSFCLVLLATGCGTQHVRFEDNPAGLDDLVYLLESNLKVYTESGKRTGEEPYQFAPFALVYTGPEQRRLGIEATLERFRMDSSGAPEKIENFSFLLGESVRPDDSADGLRRDYLFDPSSELRAAATEDGDSISTAVLLRMEDTERDRTRYFHLRIPLPEGFENGRWYRLTLVATTQPLEGKATRPAPEESRVSYEFFVSQSNTALAFGIGLTAILGFSMLGI